MREPVKLPLPIPSLLIRRIASAWLAAMAAWYAWAAIGSIRHPLNAGSDALWAWIAVAYAGAAALWHLVWRPRRAAVTWSALLGAAGLVMVVGSGELLPVLACAWILVLAASVGARALRLFGADLPQSPLEVVVFALPSGFLLLGLLALLLAVLGLLAPAGILGLLAALTLLEAPGIRRFLRRLPGPLAADSAERGILLALCGFVGLINLAWTLAPEIQYDSLNYHLAVPRAFLAAHRAVDLPHFWHSYFAQMMESLFAVCLAAGGAIAAKLSSFAIGIAAALSVRMLGRALFNERVGLWAGALFYATPMTSWLSTTAYTDLATALFLTSCLLAFLRRSESGGGWLFAAGWLAGGAFAVKATAAYGLFVIAGVLLLDLVRRRVRPAAAAGFAALAAAASLPWYALRWSFTGNPFYPLWSSLFPGARAVPAGFDAEGVVGEGYGRTGWRSLLEIPFGLTFDTDRFGEPFPAGAMGIVLAIVIPLGLVVLARRRGGAGLVLAVFAGSLAAWDLSFRGLRHGFPMLPLAAVLAVAAVDALSPPGAQRRFAFAVLGAVLLLQAALVPSLFWNIPGRVPLQRAIGKETREAFLARALPAYPAVAYLNRTAAPDEKILGVAAANLRFYLRSRVDTVGENWELAKAVANLRGDELAEKLAAMGYRRILLAGVRPAVAPGYPFLDPEFLSNHATLVFQAGGSSVYELRRGVRTVARPSGS